MRFFVLPTTGWHHFQKHHTGYAWIRICFSHSCWSPMMHLVPVGTSRVWKVPSWQPRRSLLLVPALRLSCQTHLCQCLMFATGCCSYQCSPLSVVPFCLHCCPFSLLFFHYLFLYWSGSYQSSFSMMVNCLFCPFLVGCCFFMIFVCVFHPLFLWHFWYVLCRFLRAENLARAGFFSLVSCLFHLWYVLCRFLRVFKLLHQRSGLCVNYHIHKLTPHSMHHCCRLSIILTTPTSSQSITCCLYHFVFFGLLEH